LGTDAHELWQQKAGIERACVMQELEDEPVTAPILTATDYANLVERRCVCGQVRDVNAPTPAFHDLGQR